MYVQSHLSLDRSIPFVFLVQSQRLAFVLCLSRDARNPASKVSSSSSSSSSPNRGEVECRSCCAATGRVSRYLHFKQNRQREKGGLWVQQGWGRARVVCPSVLLFVPPQGKVMVFFHTRVRDNRKRRKRTLTATEEKRKRGTIDQQTPHFVFSFLSCCLKDGVENLPMLIVRWHHAVWWRVS